MERETYRQDQAALDAFIGDTKPLGDISDVLIEEIEVLEQRQHRAGRHDASDQEQIPRLSLGGLDAQGREVVDEYGDEQYQDINWNERHVKQAA